MSVALSFTRPQGHYLASGRLSSRAPWAPISRRVGDLDKLVRAVMDGLTIDKDGDGLLADDSLAVVIHASKHYGHQSGAIITITDATPCAGCHLCNPEERTHEQ